MFVHCDAILHFDKLSCLLVPLATSDFISFRIVLGNMSFADIAVERFDFVSPEQLVSIFCTLLEVD